MNKIVLIFLITVVLTGCLARKDDPTSLKTGTWRATLELQGHELPFHLDVIRSPSDNYQVYLRNADEKILLDEVTVNGDSVDIALHVFDANIKAKIDGDKLEGLFIKNYEKDYRVPFKAVYGQTHRFEKGNDPNNIPDFSGKYAVTFSNESDTTVAVGIFKQQGDSVTGTFLTTTGDYRYLEGNVSDGKLQLSAFDGNHSYIFYATQEDNGSLKGEYYSGKTWKQTWIGQRDENAALPDAEKLTFLKPGFDRIAFSFPDVNGKKVSLDDEQFNNKVVVIQILGTWCPNCMDETRFLSPWYEQNKDRDVKVIGLAYERKPDFDYASARVKKMVSKLNVSYDVLIAGVNDKEKAAETLPMLNKVVAFPTTIFVGRDGKVKKIHTGFSGPGTGEYYGQFIQHFNETVNELLNDKQTANQ